MNDKKSAEQVLGEVLGHLEPLEPSAARRVLSKVKEKLASESTPVGKTTMGKKNEIEKQIDQTLESLRSGQSLSSEMQSLSTGKLKGKRAKAKRKLRALNRQVNGLNARLEFLYPIRDQAIVLQRVLEVIEWPLDIIQVLGEDKERERQARLYLRIENAWHDHGPIPPSADGATFHRVQMRLEKPILSQFTQEQNPTDFSVTNIKLLLQLFCWQERDRADKIENISNDDLENHFNTFATLMWLTVCMMNGGRMFRISSQLAHTFACADVSIGAEFFKLPFETVMLILPNGFSMEVNGELYKATDATMCLQEIKGSRSRLSIKIGTGTNAVKEECPTLIYNVLLGEKATIQEDIVTYQEQSVDLFSNDLVTLSVNKYDDPVYRLLTTIVNTFLYCTSFPDQIEAHNQEAINRLQGSVAGHRLGSTKRKKANSKLQQQKSSSVYIVGKHFRLDDKKCREKLEGGFKLRSRHIVRGHWRNQACGIRHQDRKLIFIQPFWKGTGKESPSKDYVVK